MATKKKPQRKKSPAARKKAVAKKQSKHPFLVCGIGCSAGGLAALEAFFRNVPDQSGVAFVVVSHQSPDRTSLLPQILQKSTPLPVLVAEDGMAVEPDHVYISRPGYDLRIQEGILKIKPVHGHTGKVALPVDIFLRSLAGDRQRLAAGVILSGTGSDGTLGLKAIKAGAGIVLAQSPDSAEYTGMPMSAIQNVEVDYVLPPEELPAIIIGYAGGELIKGREDPVVREVLTEADIEVILDLMHGHLGRDFSDYKVNSIRRRIERRMNLHLMDSAEKYIQYLRHNPHEIDLLFNELLISVTHFYRDKEAFNVLEKKGLPRLIQHAKDMKTFRAWVVGCASGEEAYSLAILLHEYFTNNNLQIHVQIFATDLDERSINIARAGVYSQGIAADINTDLLNRYFTRADSSYRIRKDIRETVIFAIQDVTRDPPFMNLDLIMCRNLLIYMNNNLQQRVLPMFQYALNPKGLLLLGSSESLGRNENLFIPIDRKWRLYERREVSANTWMLGGLASGRNRSSGRPDMSPSIPPAALPRRIQDTHISRLAEKMFAKAFVPPSVIINQGGEIYYIHGHTGPYLEPPTGQPRMNIFEMAREGLRLELTAAIH